MSFWHNITKAFSRSTSDKIPVREVRSHLPRYGGKLNLLAPSVDNALQVATVYRCVQLLGDSVASLRLQYLRRRQGRYQEDTNSPYHYLLTVQPQPEMSAYDFWNMVVKEMLIYGNAYIFPRRYAGEVTDLVLCRSEYVTQDTINNTYSFTDIYNGVFGVFNEEDVIHLYLHSSDGRKGESVLTHASRMVSLAQAGDEETLHRFSNGGTVRGLVTNTKDGNAVFAEYDDNELRNTAEHLSERFEAGETIVALNGMADFTSLSLSSTDMQFLESRKFTVRDICRFFGVHPSFVFDDSASNYKSAEMANVAFLSNTLDPILKRIENELTRKLIPRKQCCNEVFRFDRRGIYSLDLASLAAYQKATIESGVYTINDWRRRENQPEVEGGDTVMVSANLKSLDTWLTSQDNNEPAPILEPANNNQPESDEPTDENNIDNE